MLNSGTVSLVMDKFKLNKKWEDVPALIALAEFGLTRSDISTDDYIGTILSRAWILNITSVLKYFC